MAVSHSWTLPSALPAATSAPSGLNATAASGLASELIGGPVSCWVAVSHSRTFPSVPPVATVLPSGLNATAFACAGLANGRVVIRARSVRFQVPAAAASATSSFLPPPVKARAKGVALHLVALIGRCEARSHSRIAPPEYPAAKVVPSGL